MPGISNRIVSFANFYNDLEILVVVVSSFAKRDPVSQQVWHDKDPSLLNFFRP
jgi:hypothetical protein